MPKSPKWVFGATRKIDLTKIVLSRKGLSLNTFISSKNMRGLDAQTQKIRRETLLNLSRNLWELMPEPAVYEDLAGLYVVFLLESGGKDEIEKANYYCEHFCRYPTNDYGLFALASLLHAYYKFHDKLTDGARKHLLDSFRDATRLDRRVPNINFVGQNDNHPMLAMCILILSGELLNDFKLKDMGMDKMRQLYDLTNRRGALSEYNSPVYYGPTLCALATLASHTHDKKIAQQARVMQEKLFLQALAHYHPPSNQLAGPFSRSYLYTTVGSGGLLKYILYMYLEEPPFLEKKFTWTHHPWDIPWSGFIASLDFHFPPYLLELVKNRAYPWIVQSTSECGDVKEWRGTKEFIKGGLRETYTYQTETYCLGSASKPFHNGAQTESPILYWVKNKPVKKFSDWKTAFFRFLVDDAMPDRVYESRVWSRMDIATPFCGITYPCVVLNDGRFATFQVENRVVLLCRPNLLDNKARKLRLSCFITQFGEHVDEVWVGDRKVATPFSSPTPETIFIRDGDFYLALYPLPALTNLGSDVALTISEVEGTYNYLEIAFLNYAGNERDFTREDWLNVRNGLYIEAAEKKNFESFKEFRSHINSIEITESVENKVVRGVKVKDEKVEISAVFNVDEDIWIERCINGQVFHTPMFSCPMAIIGTEQSLKVGTTTITKREGIPITVIANESANTYILINTGNESETVSIINPRGSRKVETNPFEPIIVKLVD